MGVSSGGCSEFRRPSAPPSGDPAGFAEGTIPGKSSSPMKSETEGLTTASVP